MSFFSSLFFSPMLIVISIPLASFAAVTSIIAFSTLSVRVLIIYADLAVVLLQNLFIAQRTSSATRISSPEHRLHQRPSVKHRKSESSQGSSHTHLSGLCAYGNGSPTRDFEGIGGWRDPGADEEDNLWAQMNHRLQLPVTSESHQRHHHRSKTSISLIGLPLVSPSSAQSTAMTPIKGLPGRSPSPEEYFAHRKASKSATSLDAANIGSSVYCHKPSSSSASSIGSVRSSWPSAFDA